MFICMYVYVYSHHVVDARLPGKENSNSNGARPVHQIISIIKWIRTSKLSTKNSLFAMWVRGCVRYSAS